MLEVELFGLANNPKLSTIDFADEAEWLKLRSAGIGGSDIGAIMGLNKYCSPLKVYRQKVDGLVEDLSDNMFVTKGKDLEDLILTKYVQPKFRKMGYFVNKPDFMIINSDYPYLRANVDGIAKAYTSNDYKDSILIEIKWVSDWGVQNWGGEEYCGVPPSYYAQVQHYMAVTGLSKAYVCALFDDKWEMHYFEVPRDEVFIKDMLKQASTFYNYNMLMRVPPRVVYTLDKEEIIKDVTLKSTSTAVETPNPEMSKVIREYLEVKKIIKTKTKEQDDLMSTITNFYLKNNVPDDPSLKVSMTVVNSRIFNTSKFKEDNPGLYNQYVEEKESVRTNIK